MHVYGNGKQQLQAVAVAGADGLNLYDSCSAAYERIWYKQRSEVNVLNLQAWSWFAGTPSVTADRTFTMSDVVRT